MAEAKTVNAIDIGSSKIVTLVAEDHGNGEFTVLGAGLVASRGIKRGQIVDVNEAARAIRESINLAEQTSATKMLRAMVSISGSHIQSQNTHGAVAIGRGDQGVTQDDINRSLESAQAVPVPSNREVLHVIPRQFKVDDASGIRNPQGMLGYRLEAQANLVTAAVTNIQNVLKTVQIAQVPVGLNEVVLAPLAAADAVLTATEREMGVMLVDIGSGLTSVAVFLEGSLWHTNALDVGGDLFTSDLALMLRLPMEASEKLKVQYGHCNPDNLPSDHPVVAAVYPDGQRVNVQRRELAEILEARADELFSLIMQELKRSGFDSILPAGVVITGGAAQLPGLREIAGRVSGLPVRVGQPVAMRGFTDAIQGPAFSVAAGLVRWAMQENAAKPAKRRRPGGDGLRRWLKNLLP